MTASLLETTIAAAFTAIATGLGGLPFVFVKEFPSTLARMGASHRSSRCTHSLQPSTVGAGSATAASPHEAGDLPDEDADGRAEHHDEDLQRRERPSEELDLD